MLAMHCNVFVFIENKMLSRNRFIFECHEFEFAATERRRPTRRRCDCFYFFPRQVSSERSIVNRFTRDYEPRAQNKFLTMTNRKPIQDIFFVIPEGYRRKRRSNTADTSEKL